MASRKAVLNSIPKFLRPRKKFKANLREPIKTWNIVKGDKVAVIDGPHKGQHGEVLAVLRKQKRVVVQGVNVRVKHEKPTQQSPQGERVEREFPIHASNVQLIDPATGKGTRKRAQA